MITIKKIEEAMETYKDLTLFLAQCRSTIHQLATIGKRHYERAERAERKLAEVEAELKAIRSGNTKTGKRLLDQLAVPPDER
jgi:hypothetical protein